MMRRLLVPVPRLARQARLALAGFAALLAPLLPAEACSYSQVPEPVGHASAEFFAKKMASEAVFVDVAVAEDTEPAPGAGGGPRVSSTTFRVIERLKGRSPGRFALFVNRLRDGEPVPQVQHFVDEQGRVLPFPYPSEVDPAAPFITNSCDPGVMSVRPGQAYVVFREADGRLLGPVPMHDGRSQAAFPIVPVSLHEDFGWLNAATTAVADRAGQSSAGGSSTDVVAVRFKASLTRDQAERWVKAAAVRPIAIRIARGRIVEETRSVLNLSTRDLIAHAARRPPANRERYVRALAREFLDQTDEALELNSGLQRQAALLFRAAEAEPNANAAALIIGMEVAGSADAVAALTSNAQIAEVRPGIAMRGRVGTGAMVEASGEDGPIVAPNPLETGASLRARLNALAEGDPLPPARFVPVQPQPDPFSYTGCVRIGEAEALALEYPLLARFGTFSLYAAAADCEQTAEALTCRLSPEAVVRVDAGETKGGFRVGSDAVTLELREHEVRCSRTIRLPLTLRRAMSAMGRK
jgi:hypothetical protein